ncbi:MAG: hypothetical protein MKZ95_10155 [Pirellulales bacterium]|nr:hypothetical protein [Pirellulales bacterium]
MSFLLRGMKDGAGFDETILAWMALLGAIGMIVGTLAETIVIESVRTKIEAGLAAINDSEEKRTLS